MRSAVSCEPLVVSFVLSLILSLALRLLPQRTGTAPDFAPGVEVSIRSGTSGKYVEVGDNLWLYASYYSHNKPSCRFEVHEADASLVRTLTGTREYRESAGARSGWDVRGADASREADAFPGATGVDDSPEEYRPEGDWPSTADESSPLAREDEEEEEEEVGEGEAEPEEDDADGWEARGVEMLRRREYDYGCACIDKALRLRIEAAAEDESESGGELHPPLARAWYLHGDALLRRAQAMVTLAAQDGGGDAPTPVTAPAEPPAPSRTGLTGDVAALGVADAGEWRASGSAAIGRRVRRFFALHGACDGAVVGWAPESDEGDEALWHVRLDDGDEEDLDGDELDDALAAAAEGRTLEQEVELLLEAAWEALEASVALYAKQPERAAERADAHGRLADAALQNDQPERAADEYAAARAVLDDEVKAGRLTNDDRRLADVEFSMGVVALRRGDVGGARRHYTQASATLRLRSANLQRRALDAQIGSLSQQVAGGAAGPSAAATPVDAAADAAEVASIAELVAEIDVRIVEIDSAA